MTARRYRGSLAVWTLLIAYASLYPLLPMRLPSWESVLGFFVRPRYVVEFDVWVNVIAYLPLGTFACLYFGERVPRGRAIAKAIEYAGLLSVAMEALQLFVPNRVSSIYDVLANAVGALAGALVLANPLLTRPLGEMRARAVIAGRWGDAGLVLVALWILAQLNPALPFFGAGNIVEGDDAVNGLAFLQWAPVALGVCGFGLFISAFLIAGNGCLRITLVLLSAALWLKFAAASFMLQPNFAAEWAGLGRFAGLAAGIAALVPLRKMPRAGRIYVAILMVLAGALFTKIFGAYSALDDFLRVFRWPHGQLANFATLTRFLHELWPFAALTYLIAVFLESRRAPVG
jgi:VanZ family protein